MGIKHGLAAVPPLFVLLPLLCALSAVAAKSLYEDERLRMVEAIEQDVRETSHFLSRKALNPKVLAALTTVPRHEFVPAGERGAAYQNRPLPIGHGQTISQPYIVAVMTDLLDLSENDRVLEIGTGSGYQAAILAELVRDVHTIEIIKPLGRQAAKRLKRLGYGNISVRIADGYYGWEEFAPFDAIVVTAAASHIPPPLIAQLKAGGRMVIPVGSRFMVQQLVLVTKDTAGRISTRQVLPVRFVPLTGSR